MEMKHINADAYYHSLSSNYDIQTKHLLLSVFQLSINTKTNFNQFWERIINEVTSQSHITQGLNDQVWNISDLLDSRISNIRRKLNSLKQSKGTNFNQLTIDLFNSVVSLLSIYSIFYGLYSDDDKIKASSIMNDTLSIVGSELKSFLHVDRTLDANENINMNNFLQNIYLAFQKSSEALKNCILISKTQLSFPPVSKIILDLEKIKLLPNYSDFKWHSCETYLNNFESCMLRDKKSYSKEYLQMYLDTIIEISDSSSMKSVLSHPKLAIVMTEVLELKNLFEEFEKQRDRQYQYTLFKNMETVQNQTTMTENIESLQLEYSNLIKRHVQLIYKAFLSIYRFCGAVLDSNYRDRQIINELSLGSVLNIVLSITARLYAKNLIYLNNIIEPLLPAIRKCLKLKSSTNSNNCNKRQVISFNESQSEFKSRYSENTKFISKLQSSQLMTLLDEFDTKLLTYIYTPHQKDKNSEYLKAPADRVNRYITWLLYLGDPRDIYEHSKEDFENKDFLIDAMVCCIQRGFKFMVNCLFECHDMTSNTNESKLFYADPYDLVHILYDVIQLRYYGFAESKPLSNDSCDSITKGRNNMFIHLTKTLSKFGNQTSKVRVHDNLMKVLLDYIEQSVFYTPPLLFIKLPDILTNYQKLHKLNNCSYLDLLSANISQLLNINIYQGEIALIDAHKNYQKLTYLESINSDLIDQFQKYVKGTFQRHSHQLSTHTVRLYEQNSNITNDSRVLATQKTLLFRLSKDVDRSEDTISQITGSLNKHEDLIVKVNNKLKDTYNGNRCTNKQINNQIISMQEKFAKLELNIQNQVSNHRNNLNQTKLCIENLKSTLSDAEASIFTKENVFHKIKLNVENLIQNKINEKLASIISQYKKFDMQERALIAIKTLFPKTDYHCLTKALIVSDEISLTRVLDESTFGSDEKDIKNEVANRIDNLLAGEEIETKINEMTKSYSTSHIEDIIQKNFSAVSSIVVKNSCEKLHALEFKLVESVLKLQQQYKLKLENRYRVMFQKYVSKMQNFQEQLHNLMNHITLRISELIKTTESLKQSFIKEASQLMSSTLKQCRRELSQYLCDYLGDFIDIQLQYATDQIIKSRPPKFQLFENELMCQSLISNHRI